MRQELSAKGLPLISMRVGIHSGEAVVGNMGSDFLFDYTCIGDSVNLAARLEGINKYYGTEIALSNQSRQMLKVDTNLQLVDQVVVKGKSKPIAIFTVTESSIYNESNLAFSLYAEKKWDQAYKAYEAILKQEPENAIAIYYLERIRYFTNNDPGKDWCGITIFENK